jgi:DNA-binding MarR family transcriptional regulator
VRDNMAYNREGDTMVNKVSMRLTPEEAKAIREQREAEAARTADGEERSRERSALLVQTFKAIRVLLQKPRRPLDLMEDLGCSRRTVHRLLNSLEDIGFKLQTEHSGREVFYRLEKEQVKKAVGLRE